MKNKKVIVTGGLGFIGSNLVERLIAQNEVTIIDDRSTGKLDNVNHLKQDNLNMIDGSITDLDMLYKIIFSTLELFLLYMIFTSSNSAILKYCTY